MQAGIARFALLTFAGQLFRHPNVGQWVSTQRHMHRLAHTIRVILALSVVAPAWATARAQAIVQRPGGGGVVIFELSDGEPISYFLEHSRSLELSDSQKVSLMEVRRRLRQTNAPFMHQLDSLRELLGVSLEPRPRISPDERQALQRFQLRSQGIVDSVRANNQAAQQEARTYLSEHQRTVLDSLVTSDRTGPSGRGRGGRRPPS